MKKGKRKLCLQYEEKNIKIDLKINQNVVLNPAFIGISLISTKNTKIILDQYFFTLFLINTSLYVGNAVMCLTYTSGPRCSITAVTVSDSPG